MGRAGVHREAELARAVPAIGQQDPPVHPSARESPRRIQSVLAGMEQAQRVAVWITQAGLTPKPRLVDRRVLERDADCLELRDLLVKIVALEVDGCGGWRDHLSLVKGQCAVAVWTDKARVAIVSDNLL